LAADYGVPPDRLSVVQPGTDKVAARVRENAGEVVLLPVGAVIPRKGYDVLVTALARLAHLRWRLVIAGDGGRSPDTLRRLEAEITALDLADRITLLGLVG